MVRLEGEELGLAEQRSSAPEAGRGRARSLVRPASAFVRALPVPRWWQAGRTERAERLGSDRVALEHAALLSALQQLPARIVQPSEGSDFYCTLCNEPLETGAALRLLACGTECHESCIARRYAAPPRPP